MTESTDAPTDFTATNGEGDNIDLRDLTDDELAAYRAEAEEHGDHGCIDTIDWIVRSRIAAEEA